MCFQALISLARHCDYQPRLKECQRDLIDCEMFNVKRCAFMSQKRRVCRGLLQNQMNRQ